MEEVKLDIMAPREEQLKVLVPYLEESAKSEEEKELPVTTRTRVLIDRYMWDWKGLFNERGLTTKGAFIYYKELIKERE
jgi:hypothetical protein